MPIKHVDNADTTLAGGLGPATISMTVATGDGAKFPAVDRTVDPSDRVYITFVRQSDGAIEVAGIDVHDGISDTMTIARDVRNVSGGVGLILVLGDVVDARVPAELLDGLVQTNSNNTAPGLQSIQVLTDVASGAVAIQSVVIGSGINIKADGGSGADQCVVIGHDTNSTDQVVGRNVLIGAFAATSSDNCVGIGRAAVPAGNGAISIGSGSRTGSGASIDGITIGRDSFITEDDCIWLGARGDAGASDGLGMIAIGHDHDLTPGSAKDNGIIIGKGFTSKTPGAESFVVTRPITMNTSGKTDAVSSGVSIGNSGVENVICTQVIDFKNGSPFEGGSNAFHEFDFGANGLFFVESVEMWVQVVFGGAITTANALKVGSTVGASNILAAHTFGTSFATNTRERVSPVLLPDSGFNSIFIEVTQAAIGPTVMQGVFIIRGTLYGQ